MGVLLQTELCGVIQVYVHVVVYRCSATDKPLLSYRCVCMLLCTGVVLQSSAVPVIQRPQSAVQDVGGTVRLKCIVSERYQFYFQWQRYQSSDRSSSEELVYSTYNNTDFRLGPGFPSERFHRFGLYGLSITSLTASDGASYACQFIQWNLKGSANVFVIGLCFVLYCCPAN